MCARQAVSAPAVLVVHDVVDRHPHMTPREPLAGYV
jgi:hypothetical protein